MLWSSRGGDALSFLPFIIMVGIICSMAAGYIALLVRVTEWVHEKTNWTIAFLFITFCSGVTGGAIIFLSAFGPDKVMP